MSVHIGGLSVAGMSVGGDGVASAYLGDKLVFSAAPAFAGLTFTALEAGSTVAMKKNGTAPAVSLEYSTDGRNWYPFVVNTTTVTLPSVGSKVFIKAGSSGNAKMASSSSYYNYFVLSGRLAASGNVNSLLKEDTSTVTLSNYSYCYLFKNCSALVSAPEFPADVLASYCYYYAFSGCTSLVDAPRLPSKQLASYCYAYMFNGCTSLVDAPVMPATSLQSNCYSHMFASCSSLKTITLAYTGTISSTNFATWVSGVSSSGTIYYDGPTATVGTSAIPSGWTKSPCRFLRFYASESASTVTLAETNEYAPPVDLFYSVDFGYTWSKYDAGHEVSVGTHNSVLFVAGPSGNTAFYRPGGTVASSGGYRFHLTGGSVAVYGNMNSMLSDSPEAVTSVHDYAFYRMFENCSLMTSAPSLPAPAVGTESYSGMFSGCTALVAAPALPAAALGYGCYESMFDGCSGLTSAPALPAGTLAEYCYSHMFSGCSSLTAAPSLPAAVTERHCYSYMFSGCSKLTTVPSTLASGTISASAYQYMFENCVLITKTPTFTVSSLDHSDITGNGHLKGMFSGCAKLATVNVTLSADTLTAQCYAQMFAGCKVLKSAPALPATHLAAMCYNGMFDGCSALTSAPSLPSEASFDGGFVCSSMFRDCTSLVTAPALPATMLANSCYSSMFSGCTALVTAPELPATTLVSGCYRSMFSGCVKLNSIKVGFTAWNDSTGSTEEWVFGVAASGTFVRPRGLADQYDDSHVPTGWSSVFACTVTFLDYDGTTLSTVIVNSGTAWSGVSKPTARRDGYVFKSWGNAPATITDDVTVTAQYEISSDMFGFSSSTGECSLSLVSYGSTPPQVSLMYTTSVAGADWTDYENGTEVSAPAGEKLYFRAKTSNSGFGNPNGYSYGGWKFSTSSSGVAAFGNAMYLLSVNGGTSFSRNRALSALFEGCTGLVDAGSLRLPVVNLSGAQAVYAQMFASCTGLTTGPALPATTLGTSCYYEMFAGCTALASLTRPYLYNVTNLPDYCGYHMFYGCSSFAPIMKIAAKTAYRSAFDGAFAYTNIIGYVMNDYTNVKTIVGSDLNNHSFDRMFEGITSKSVSHPKTISVGFDNNWPTYGQTLTLGWVSGVPASATHTFTSPYAGDTAHSDDLVPVGWTARSATTEFTSGYTNTPLS